MVTPEPSRKFISIVLMVFLTLMCVLMGSLWQAEIESGLKLTGQGWEVPTILVLLVWSGYMVGIGTRRDR